MESNLLDVSSVLTRSLSDYSYNKYMFYNLNIEYIYTNKIPLFPALHTGVVCQILFA